MVSYADMITILMSFFVVMFSIASGEAAKGKRSQQQQVAIESLQYRFGPKWKPFMSWSMMPGNALLPGGGKGLGSPATGSAVGNPGGTVRVLKVEKARIRVPGQGDQIAIGGMIYFHPATADITPGQNAWIQKIAEELRGKLQQVEVVATASSRPLPRGCAFRDRWESQLRPLPQGGRSACLVECRAGTFAVVGPAGYRPGKRGGDVLRSRRSRQGLPQAPPCPPE